MGNVNQPTSTSYKTTPTPSVNCSYPGMSQTNVQTPRSTGLQGNNSLAGSHTLGGNSNRDYLPSRCSCYKTTTTPSVTQNRALTWKMYGPPPRSNEYKAPTPSVNHNSSLMSHPNDHQPITDIVNFPQPELQRTKRKDNNCGCCTIL
ncbi:hypothetical protein KP79_PYT20593 [Mizuhopecten yessoensis]|uniref:Uncharacterized protein n=1 Tax=Mizuhopecten yessoensis TaxID=6573 RepID=A0A210PY70_MIZYE|nr:hypothetical protein KP79_PYT20593 [Mizuhopecten yessoensis]